MKLAIMDRLVLNGMVPQMLPAMGSRMLYEQIDKMARELSFSEDEIARYEMIVEGEGVRWNTEKDEEKDIEMSDTLKSLIVSGFKRLDGEGKLPREAMSVFDKFVSPEEWAKEK